MKKNRIKSLLFLLSFIVISSNYSGVSIKSRRDKEDIYDGLYHNEYISDEDRDKLFLSLMDDFNINHDKKISNIFNYCIYMLNFNKHHNSYYGYLTTLTGDSLNMDIDDNMIPQGITCYKDYVIVSAYNENRLFSSFLYVINQNTNYIREVELDNSSHVGGITYDDDNKLLWVCVGDKLCGYKINDVMYKNKINKHYETSSFENMGKCSFITYKDNKMYIGNYCEKYDSIVGIYDLSYSKRNGNINFIYNKSLIIPSKIQGADFMESNNQTYLLLSKSYNIFDDSKILLYKYDDNNTDYRYNYFRAIKCPPMLEEIKVLNNEEVIALYESGASKYSDCLININNLYYSNLKKKLRK